MQKQRSGERKPIVGIGCDVVAGPPAAIHLRLEYCDAISDAGGVPVVLPPRATEDRWGRVLEALDGIILSGGPDYDPSCYGCEPHPALNPIHPRRQSADLSLARQALECKLPVLGICGGHQLLNIALGGDLIQHIPDQIAQAGVHAGPSGGPPAPSHKVRITPGTLLDRLVGRRTLSVNTYHHQAVGRLGQGLQVSALADDGVVEAIEAAAASERFLLGVQWHPERDPTASSLAIFSAFVEAASGAAREGRR